jgi:hypothetical protein
LGQKETAMNDDSRPDKRPNCSRCNAPGTERLYSGGATASLRADAQADEFEIIHARQLTQFANDAAGVINNKINLPADRIQSGVVHGVLISALHDLLSMEAEYSRPSP